MAFEIEQAFVRVYEEGDTIPRVYYAEFHPGPGGPCSTESAHCRILDGHYLLVECGARFRERNTGREDSCSAHFFGIVDMDKPEIADQRIYRRIRDRAEDYARGFGVEVEDSTSPMRQQPATSSEQ